jgi:mRNA interferase HigB
MQLLGKQHINNFKKKHATSRKALDRWAALVETAVIEKPEDFRKVFGNSFDKVKDKYVFDVGGNKIRVIAITINGVERLLVTHVLTHQEYDQNRWK